MTDSAGQVAASRTPGAEPLTRSHFLIESLPLKPAEEKRKDRAIQQRRAELNVDT